jgi:hypothetical protein
MRLCFRLVPIVIVKGVSGSTKLEAVDELAEPGTYGAMDVAVPGHPLSYQMYEVGLYLCSFVSLFVCISVKIICGSARIKPKQESCSLFTYHEADLQADEEID